MLRNSSPKFVKKALWGSRLKIVYTRITLTRFTLLYFIVAFLTCVVLVGLQGLAYYDNSNAANLISDILIEANVTNGLTILSGNLLQYCHDIPSERDSNCVPIRPGNLTSAITGNTTDEFMLRGDSAHSFAKRDLPTVLPVFNSSGAMVGVKVADSVLPVPCLQSFSWLGDVLQDSRKEDVVTLLYQIWMLSLSIIAILNESLPHLGAPLAGHILGTAWASFRVSSSKHLQARYNRFIVHGTCDGIDLLQDWWTIRTRHTIPVVVLNGVALLTLLYLSANLYKVYANQSFSRVGGSPEINRIYKFVLLFSVMLQLAGFFALAATGMWIDKISGGSIRRVARHLPLYLAVFGVTAACELPWVVLGWISVRREYRRLFVVFGVLSLFLLGVSTFMFASPLYRFIFMSWPFFATMTVTTYILLVATSALGVVCRLHFDKGLAQFLRVSDTLEGMDFTPAYFSKNVNDVDDIVGLKRSASEKSYASSKKVPLDEKEMPDIQEPSAAHFETRAGYSLSVYSDSNRPTMKFTSTPKVARSQRTSTVSTATALTSSTTSTYNKQSRSTTKSTWKEQSNRPPTRLFPFPQRQDTETASLVNSITTVVRKDLPVISTPRRMKSSQAKDAGIKSSTSTSASAVSKESTPPPGASSSVPAVIRQDSPDSLRGPRLPASPRPSKPL
ncbi:uncharacterized protein BT62DRAFT_967139 [Guyanagaster necrorhizus]|uniref:Uncharacterized protein n=1 Tax=Guyanagaster necrorhizus TaxID=856835 RepID=A0A9P7VVA9_9AGAR|nr:uncharacterized protein BT62DRAFT_967139 [Guyanagaster necrorhizus MCA 3950]KAG7447263.1 hypothetical protein BT62DRAFT_967139 [Guyanagaster necrorhizus MCA 3950]